MLLLLCMKGDAFSPWFIQTDSSLLLPKTHKNKTENPCSINANFRTKGLWHQLVM